MPRYICYIEYLGTNYRGWQNQPDQPTIQGTIEQVLQKVYQTNISIYGQGRTDAGVHALGQIAHFDIPHPIDTYKLQHAFLGLLPKDIVVWKIEAVDANFHARFDAIRRTYLYRIATRPTAHFGPISTLITQPLNVNTLQACANIVIGNHDFRNIAQEDENHHHYFCRVDESYWKQEDAMLTYTISANRFLRHLVRRLVGTMIRCAQGKFEIEKFEKLLYGRQTCIRPHKAAARGLTLVRVHYDDLKKAD